MLYSEDVLHVVEISTTYIIEQPLSFSGSVIIATYHLHTSLLVLILPNAIGFVRYTIAVSPYPLSTTVQELGFTRHT